MLIRIATVGVVLFVAGHGVAGGENLLIQPGDVVFDAKTESYVETFSVPPNLCESIRQAEFGQRLDIEAFPVEPGIRMPVRLERIEIYAPSARVIVVGLDGVREAPRSDRLYFRGWSPWDPDVVVGLSVDRTTGAFRGLVRGAGGVHVLTEPTAQAPATSRIGTPSALRPAEAPPLEITCGTDSLPPDPTVETLPPATGSPPMKSVNDDPPYAAVIAFDTDQEWLYYRFSDNTTSATTWIADYLNASNVMYERDLGVRLLVGTTYLRTGGPPFTSDPYSVSQSPAGVGMLNEFGTYWDANYDAVDRVFAQLLSGKSSSSYSSSGIAWLDGYCEHQSSGGGYSIFEPFKATAVAMASNVRVGAHELGHNAGSPHTHCYDPVIDQCYSGESGCYSGSTSCPGGPGTMMSYCHFNGCGDNQILFHSRVIDLLDGYRAAHTPWCIEELGDPDLIFADDFEGGTTDAW